MRMQAPFPWRWLWLAVPLLLALLPGTRAWADAPVKVASLSTVLSDVARNVGGDKVQVIDLVRAGVDPHEFQPSPGDVQSVAGADVVLISGKGLEGYLAKLEQSAGGGGSGKFTDIGSGVCIYVYQGGKYVDIGDALPGGSLRLQERGQTVEDPHWWHSIENVRRAVNMVCAVFRQVDPADKDAFTAQAAAYQTRLGALDSAVKLKVAELPRGQRKLVTSHDAFGYFARDYGFTVYPVEGVSPTDEPSSKQVAELIDTIKQQRVKAVFFENTQNPKVLDAITRETGAVIGGELYADGLGAPGGDAATYEGMMRHNVDTVVNALK